ncbi:hypothetical protein WA026_005443 [Henosepilachna vigintioctopunctata]|uniref:Ionotropic receptor n=1 Tax=Henosepilachna vigintioctopunctata TaxID=420089 RepID=A0AAW1TWE9_9CUCU
MLGLILVCFMFTTNAISIRTRDEQKTYQQIESFIIKSELWVKSTFSQTTLLTMDNSDAAYDVVKIILQTLHFPTVVFDEKYFSVDHKSIQATLAIVLIEVKENIDIIVRNLLNSTSYEVKTPVVLIICKKVKKYALEVEYLLPHICRFGLTRFILVYVTDKVHAKTYNPFTRKILNIQQNHDAETPNFLRNLRGHRLRVGLFEEWPLIKAETKLFSRRKWMGRDYELLKVVVKILNATYKIIEPPKNTRYEGAIKDLIRGKTDFCFVRQFQAGKYDNIEPTEYNEMASFDILVPKPRQLKANEAFFKTFRIEIWVGIAFCIILLLVVLKLLLDYYTHPSRWGQEEILLDLWGILMNVPIRNLRKYKRVLKMPIISWIWACLIFAVSFQCRLIDLMQSPYFDKGIRTLEDLEKSKLPIYSSFNYTDIMGNASLFRHHYRSLNHTELQDFVWGNETNVAFAMPFVVIRGHINPFMFPLNHTPSHVILKEPLFHSFAVYLFQKNSPYTHAVSKALMIQRQYGFSKKITRMSKEVDVHRVSRVKRLSIYHVQTAFILLAIGLILSFVVFIYEQGSLESIVRPKNVNSKRKKK